MNELWRGNASELSDSAVSPAQVIAEGPVHLERETPSSVELTRNAKGEMQWVIKCYVPAGLEGSAALTAVAVDDSLRREYGLPGRLETT